MAGTRLWRTVVLALILAACFVWFNWSSLRVHFAVDEMMNLDYAWRLKPWQLLLAPLMPWRPFYRPLAAWIFVPLLDFFGLDPLPFHVAMQAFVLANVFLIWRLARRLHCGEWQSWIVAFLTCYHVGLSNLYHNTAYLYDAMCGFFFVAALLYYVRIRQRGQALTWRQTAIFLCLYLAALDSKEMAFTLPAVMLLYEWFYEERPARRIPDVVAWLRGRGLPLMLAGCLNLVYFYGRVAGDNGLARDAGYIPKLSMARVWKFQVESLADLFEKWEYFNRFWVVGIWIALFYLAWRRPRPVLRFSCLFLLLTPLPIEFLLGRSGACLYIPMVGWAMFVTVVAADITGAIAGFLAKEPVLRWVGRNAIAFVLMAAALGLWTRQNAQYKAQYVDPSAANVSPDVWDAIEQMRALNLHVRPHGKVIFLNDPFGTFEMAFIAELMIHDRSVTVLLNRQLPVGPEEIASADRVIDYRDGRLLRVR